LRVYSSAPAANAIEHVHDTIVRLVEPTEVNGSEVDGPDAFGDLLESDGVAFQETADEDLPALPSERAVAGDPAELKVSGVFKGIGAVGERTVRGSIDGGGRFHLQGLVRTLLVIDSTESVERALLSP